MIKRSFLVTGASKGIGRALSTRLVAAGHQVVGLARNADPSFPGTLVPVDLGDRAATAAVLADLVQRFDFSGVVNNVGLVRPQRLGSIELDDVDAVFRVNLHSAIQTAQAILPQMKAKGWGRIVNVSSLTILGIVERTAYAAAKAGLVSFARSWALELDDVDAVFRVNLHSAIQTAQAILPQMKAQGWGRIVNVSSLTILGIVERTAYAAAKAGLVSFARSWALELAQTGITVNSVAPGPTETELFRANSPPGSEGERRYLSVVPMGRFAKPDEIAAAIAFLLSEDAGFITGQTLFVDGGASIGKVML